MPEYLKRLCRTCLRSGEQMEMFPLFNADAIQVAGICTAVDIIKMLTSTALNNAAEFPDHICGVCLNEIQQACIFKRKCEKSEKILHQMKEIAIKVKKLKKSPLRNEKNDRKYPHADIKEEPEEIINDYEDLVSKNIANEIKFNNFHHTSSELQTTFKSERESIIEDFSYRLIYSNETEQDKKQFKCPACERESQSLVMFFDHIISDHIEGNLCKICNAEFVSNKFDHSAKHHPAYNCNDLFHDLTSSYLSRLNHKELSDLDKERIGEKFVDEEVIDEKFVDDISDKSFESLSGRPKIQCKICLKILPRKHDLKTHMVIHIGEKLFECKLCLAKFRQESLLQFHMGTKHANEFPDFKPKHQCQVCLKSFAYDADLKRHILNHTGEKPFKCELCLRKFLNKRSLKKHFRTKHKKVPISLKSKNQCSVCSTTFTRNIYLRIHMRLHSDETLFQCEFCSKQFQYKKLLRIHIASKHSDKLSDGKPRYQCYVCSKIFSYNNHLTSHMRTHKVDKPFECKLCSEKFWYSSSLMSHMKTKHTEELPGDEPMYNCSDCSNIFNSNEHLLIHMTEHTDRKPIQSELRSERFQLLMTHTKTEYSTKSASFKPKYQCGNCSITFVNNNHLIMHMRRHSLDKPFQCELCLETFHQNSFLCHMKTRHAEELTGTKPKNQCNICSKIFGYNKDLNRHMLSHTGERPLQCEICSEKFRYKPSLEHHMKERHPNGMNLPEPKYECKICSRICRRQNDLNTHMRCHIQNNLFKCDLCSEKFKQKSSLICHMKWRHSDQLPENIPKHKCNICSKIFDYHKDLSRHMLGHTGEKFLQCEKCLEKFRLKPSLVRHMKEKHPTGMALPEPKYECKICSRISLCKNDLKTHMRSHIPKVLFKCDLCSKQFEHKESLNRHIKLKHSDHNDCPGAFVHKKDLVSHMCSHKAKEMFECKLCSTKFAHKVSFLRHMRTHHPEEALEPERNYQCDLCLQRFRRQDNLLRHMRRHSKKTGDNPVSDELNNQRLS